ncbi:N-acetyltransferase family protein [Puniceibacterium sp. IMCC21224]|uniref:GNAT family N-acetyltransferase n=1 Tax=Puniceibacterium sp. IMCC21224 TaxID=1618204 RepID=UPI00350F3598
MIIRPVLPEDRAQWDALYRGYAGFYRVEQTEGMRDTVWSWLHDDSKETCGLVAQGAGGRLVGLTQYRPFARPLAATTGCFLDDLFVAPEARGQGVAEALIDGVRAVAADNGWSVVRWITAENNYRGRAVYDRVATRTPWVTYDIKP